MKIEIHGSELLIKGRCGGDKNFIKILFYEAIDNADFCQMSIIQDGIQHKCEYSYLINSNNIVKHISGKKELVQ